tara:strand:- start:211 stop:564 length:354 start_codon:yes stop_codon:yes gene_type:complete
LFSTASAELVRVIEDSDKIFFVETNMIIPHVDKRRMAKELHEILKPGQSGVTSLRIRSEYDCGKSIFRELAVDEIMGEMGVGKVIKSSSTPTQWKKIKTSSGRQKVFNYICSYVPKN